MLTLSDGHLKFGHWLQIVHVKYSYAFEAMCISFNGEYQLNQNKSRRLCVICSDLSVMWGTIWVSVSQLRSAP